MAKTIYRFSPLFLCLVAASAAYADGLQQRSPLEAQRVSRAEAHLNAKRQRDSRHAFRVENSFSDTLGQTHVRFRQTYQGVPVWGGEAIIHVSEQDDIRESMDAVRGSLQLDVQPSLSKTEALAVLFQTLQPSRGLALDPQIELMVYPTPSGDAKLVYYIQAALDNPEDGLQEPHALVDAHSGEILKQWEGLNSNAVGTGKTQHSGSVQINTNKISSGYELRDLTRGIKGNQVRNLDHATQIVAGTSFVDTDNSWGDGQNYIAGGPTDNENGQTAAVDVAYGIQATWDYYKQVHNRNGVDNTGKEIFAGAHYHTLMDNAAWSNVYFCMVIGDGSAPNANGLKSLGSLDIVAHEFSHGVCGNSAKLVYAGESGGLNEANSDIQACMVEFHARSGGGSNIPDQQASSPTAIDGGNWVIGEQVSQNGEPMRYMYKPSLDRVCPDFWYPEIGSIDVHYSSGPMNRAFYFLSCGATTSGETSTATNTPAFGLTNVNFLPDGMKGIGNDKAARIWYRALTTYMTNTTDYFAARKACQKAATDLYGAGSAELAAVNNAFAAINVGFAAGKADDVQVPAVQSLTSNGSTSETITFTIKAQDDNQVSRVLIFVDSTLMGKAVQNGASWVFNFDSTCLGNGSHKVKAVAYDGYNNTASSELVFNTQNTTFHPILNGGFENGLANWRNSKANVASLPINLHSGAKAVWLGGFGSATTGYVSQSVDIPSTATSAQLSFWMRVGSKDATSANNDTLKVRLLDSTGKELGVLKTFSNQDAPTYGTHSEFTFDLKSYKGQKVDLRFDFSEDATLATAFYMDDVAVDISTTTTTTPTVKISLTPSAVSLKTGQTQQFNASVTGTTTTGVTWSASSGTISTTGLYKAPTTPGTYTVTATTLATPQKSAQAIVTVTADAQPQETVTLTPKQVTLASGTQQQFTATTLLNKGVNWTATGGTISTTGLYTAPATPGTYTVRATSTTDATRYAEAIATVQQPVATDLIKNGDFELGSVNWTGSTGAIGTWEDQKPYSGKKNAWLGGYGTTQSDAISQTLSIPASASSATLRFALHIDTAETTKVTAYDKFVVQILSGGKVIATPLTRSNLNAQTGYQMQGINLLAYKGQSIQIRFQSTEDSSAQTSFVVDGISLK